MHSLLLIELAGGRAAYNLVQTLCRRPVTLEMALVWPATCVPSLTCLQEFTIAARQRDSQRLARLVDEVLPAQAAVSAEQLLQMAAMCRGGDAANCLGA